MPVKHILLAILVAAIWGGNFIFAKLGVHEIPPLFLCAVRFFLASVPAIFFLRWPAAPFRLVVLYGLIIFALQFSLIFCGIASGVQAGMASLLLQTTVFFSIIFAAIFLYEIPSIWQLAGALISFSGIALAASHINGEMTLSGFMLVIAGAAAMGFGTLINKKLGRVNMFALVAWGSFVSFPPLLILSLWLEGTEKISYAIHHSSSLGIISLLYIVYMSTWVGYGLWGWLLSRHTVIKVVPFTMLTPVFAILGSAIYLDEAIEPWKITVAILVISGLLFNFLIPLVKPNAKLIKEI